MLDYIRRKGEPDRTPEQMRQDIDVFLRECRKEYRKAGLEFKYIHVMEIGKKGARHHHLVVNKIDTAASLQMQRAYSVLLSTREKSGQRYITATRTAAGSVAQMR